MARETRAETGACRSGEKLMTKQPTPKQLAKLQQAAGLILAKYPAHVAHIKRELIENFDAPAQRTINAGFARMGQDRFIGSDDVWEMITAIESNGEWEYNRPPAHVMQRWACA
jgi:hypothetical protein